MTSTVYYKNRRDRLTIDRGEAVGKAYSSWACMRNRVKNPLRCKRNGSGYIGLTISDEWDDFEKFLDDMGTPPANHSIDRIDTTKGYCKENCRWATPSTQVRNRMVTKLNTEAVKVIRYFRHELGFTIRRIANAYGISPQLARSVAKNQIWIPN